MTIGGMELDEVTGRLRITYGSRVAATTDGTLVCLLPTLQTFMGQALTFPDPPKDWIYAWRGKQEFVSVPFGGYEYGKTETAQVFFTRTPQEYEGRQKLVDAPDGADFFAGFVRLNRTVAPTHQWRSADLVPLQREGQWMPWLGSGLMEVGVGLARAMHLVIEPVDPLVPDGPKGLYLIAEQTVGPATGGAVHNWGDVTPTAIYSRRHNGEGGSFRVNTTPGLIVWALGADPYRRSRFVSQNTSDTGFPTPINNYVYGGIQQCSTVDPTNYQSVYSVDVKGHFGRRS